MGRMLIEPNAYQPTVDASRWIFTQCHNDPTYAMRYRFSVPLAGMWCLHFIDCGPVHKAAYLPFTPSSYTLTPTLRQYALATLGVAPFQSLQYNEINDTGGELVWNASASYAGFTNAQIVFQGQGAYGGLLQLFVDWGAGYVQEGADISTAVTGYAVVALSETTTAATKFKLVLKTAAGSLSARVGYIALFGGTPADSDPVLIHPVISASLAAGPGSLEAAISCKPSGGTARNAMGFYHNKAVNQPGSVPDCRQVNVTETVNGEAYVPVVGFNSSFDTWVRTSDVEHYSDAATHQTIASVVETYAFLQCGWTYSFLWTVVLANSEWALAYSPMHTYNAAALTLQPSSDPEDEHNINITGPDIDFDVDTKAVVVTGNMDGVLSVCELLSTVGLEVDRVFTVQTTEKIYWRFPATGALAVGQVFGVTSERSGYRGSLSGLWSVKNPTVDLMDGKEPFCFEARI